jgi:AraC family transcriptional regulator of arabinose operon
MHAVRGPPRGRATVKPRPVSFRVELAAGITHMRSRDDLVDRPDGMDGWILNYTIAGSGRINRGARLFATRPGQVLLFKPLVPHDYSFASEAGEWVHLWVYFFPRGPWYDWLAWPEASPGILRLDLAGHALRQRILDLCEEIVRLMHGPQPRRIALASSVLEQALLWCDAANPLAGHVRLDPRIQGAIDWLAEHPAERVSIPALAQRCDLSPSRLSHLFRAQLGVPPLVWVERHRLGLATEQLLLTGRSIAEIARSVGFPDPVWFSRVFRRRMGVSPRAFRRGER